MKDFRPEWSFGPSTAAHYDDVLRGDEQIAADVLAELAGDGPALEFAIGTGRIARPLSRRGLRVDGIELSAAMIEVLRGTPEGADLQVTHGDMASVRLPGRYPLVYLVYNTIFNVLTQQGQVAVFRNAAAHLTPGGLFLIEAAVPSAWLPSHEYTRPERVEADRVVLDICRYDPVTQILEENHVTLAAEGTRFAPIACRLAWPSELDLMAELAGLRLVERWGGWHRQPYTGHDQHVSSYTLAD